MADGSGRLLPFTTEVEVQTAPIWEKVKTRVTPIEWRLHAPLIAAINALKA
jgi:quinolinate synthase